MRCDASPMPDSQPATITVSGQAFSPALIQRVNDAVAEDPTLSRAQLARQVCQWLDWTDPKGKLQNSSANVALSKLADLGFITLPPNTLRIVREPSSLRYAVGDSMNF